MTSEINIPDHVLCAYQISSVDYDLLPTVTAGRVMDVRIQLKPYHVRFQSSILPRVTYCKLNGEPATYDAHFARCMRLIHILLISLLVLDTKANSTYTFQ